jgi:hypothetical protein
MSHKCFQCLQPGHTFRNCSEVTCVCDCVSQLASFPKNESVDKVSDKGPRFLQVRNEEIPFLIYPYKQINRFMKIRESEWLPSKIDKRRKVTKY